PAFRSPHPGAGAVLGSPSPESPPVGPEPRPLPELEAWPVLLRGRELGDERRRAGGPSDLDSHVDDRLLDLAPHGPAAQHEVHDARRLPFDLDAEEPREPEVAEAVRDAKRDRAAAGARRTPGTRPP